MFTHNTEENLKRQSKNLSFVNSLRASKLNYLNINKKSSAFVRLIRLFNCLGENLLELTQVIVYFGFLRKLTNK